MNEPLDGELRAFLGTGPERGPIQGLERALAEVHRTSQRPGWAFPERWLPVQVSMQRVAVPRAASWLLVAMVLLVVLALGVLVAGSRTPPVPAPLGPGVNGQIAYDTPDGRIWLMRPDGTGRHPITPAGEFACCMSWSADGTRLAFYTFPGRIADQPAEEHLASVVVVAADGTDRQVVASGFSTVSPRSLNGPTWSHDGTKLAFTYNPSDLVRITGVYAADGTRLAEFLGAAMPAWSPDDKRLALRHVSDGVVIADAEGGVVDRTPFATNASMYASSSPAWSPDGRLIAYTVAPLGEVHIAAVDGSSDISVEYGGSSALWPAWSPDGRQLAFQRMTDDGAKFSIVDSDGSNLHDLVSDRLVSPTAWSPDGRYLVSVGTGQTGPGSLVLVAATPEGTSRTISPPEDGSFGRTSWQWLAP